MDPRVPITFVGFSHPSAVMLCPFDRITKSMFSHPPTKEVSQ